MYHRNAFFGGLEQLIGPPKIQVEAAVRDEHCNVDGGFGASDEEVKSNNYGVLFTPKSEYLFAAAKAEFDKEFGSKYLKEDGAESPGLDAGVNPDTRKSLGVREYLDISELLQTREAGDTKVVVKIRQHFEQMDWPVGGITQEMFDDLNFSGTELVTLRLYTGPVRVFVTTTIHCFL